MVKDGLLKFMAVALVALLPRFALADELLDRAKVLLEQRKAADAFVLLDSEEITRAGDVSYDLIFGITAVEAGQNTRAVFALERVLALEPNNSRARAEIARAYLAMGETAAARQEFESVQKQGASPEVSAIIDRYLEAVDRLDTVSRTTVRGYIEGSLGYDTNVNAATSKSTIAIPSFGGLPFTMADDSKAKDAPFATLGGGLNVRTPINSTVALVGGLSGVMRNNFGARSYDNLSADAYAGVVINKDKNVFSLNAQFNQYELSSDRYRTAAGVTGQWQYNLNSRNQLSAFAQYSDLRYQTLSVRNAERWMAGGALAHAYRGGEVVFASAYAAFERPRDSSVRWFGFDGIGLRLGGQMNYDAKTVLFAGGSIEYRRYDEEDPTFLRVRKDTQYDLVLGANYTPAKYWKVTPRITWTFNDSNTEINKYDREAVSVTVRRDF